MGCCWEVTLPEVLSFAIPEGDATPLAMQEAQVQLRERQGRGLTQGVNI